MSNKYNVYLKSTTPIGEAGSCLEVLQTVYFYDSLSSGSGMMKPGFYYLAVNNDYPESKPMYVHSEHTDTPLDKFLECCVEFGVGVHPDLSENL